MMKHTDKVILIPSEISESSKPIDVLLGSLDSEMHKILSTKNIPLDMKVLKYNQVLRRFSRLEEKKRQPYKIDITRSKPDIIEDAEILLGMPAKFVPNAKMLLNHIRTNRNIEIEPSGEVVINGQKIYGSNIVDLVHDLARERRNVTGMPGIKEILKTLSRANIPIQSIGSKKHREILSAARTNADFDWDESL